MEMQTYRSLCVSPPIEIVGDDDQLIAFHRVLVPEHHPFRKTEVMEALHILSGTDRVLMVFYEMPDVSGDTIRSMYTFQRGPFDICFGIRMLKNRYEIIAHITHVRT